MAGVRARELPSPFAFVLSLLGVALAASALVRPVLLGNDSFGYLDVARNAARGSGLAQSALGFNAAELPREASGPAPFTTQAPLFPVLVAALIRLGLAPIPALLLVQALSLLVLCLLVRSLAAAAWGREAGMLAAAFASLTVMFPGFLQRAWSELPALALALGAFVLDARAEAAGRTRRGAAWSFASGLAAGGAFATRYALVVGLPVGALRRLAGGARDGRALLAFVAGWFVVAGPVLVRNVLLTGHASGGAHAPFPLALGDALAETARLLARHRAGVLLGVGALGLLAIHVRRAGSWREAWRTWPGRGPGWMLLWTGLYVSVVLAARTHVGFDAIGLRLLAPALAVGLVYAAGLLAAAWRPSPGAGTAFASALVLASALAVGGALARGGPAVSPAERIAALPRLRWVRDHAAPADLVVCENGSDLPYWFRGRGGGPRLVVCFSGPPYMRPFGPDDLVRLAGRYRDAHPAARNAWLLVYRRESEDPWPAAAGECLARLSRGEDAGRGLVRVAELPGMFVYRIEAGGGPPAAGPGRERPDS